MSDAPVENAVTVVACFSQIELKSSDSANNQTFLIGDTLGTATANDLCTDSNDAIVANTRGIDLLSFAGADSTELLNNIEINPGNYNQIRLVMSPLSYATVEFDLRKGMTHPVGQEGYILKPRGVRIVDNTESGHIEGTVSEALLMNNMCDVMPEDLSETVASVSFELHPFQYCYMRLKASKRTQMKKI